MRLKFEDLDIDQIVSMMEEVEREGFNPEEETYDERIDKKLQEEGEDILTVGDVKKAARGYETDEGLEVEGVEDINAMSVEQRGDLRGWWMDNLAPKGDKSDFGGHINYESGHQINYDIVEHKLEGTKRGTPEANKVIGEAKNKWAEAVIRMPEEERLNRGLPARDVMLRKGGIEASRKQNIINRLKEEGKDVYLNKINNYDI